MRLKWRGACDGPPALPCPALPLTATRCRQKVDAFSFRGCWGLQSACRGDWFVYPRHSVSESSQHIMLIEQDIAALLGKSSLQDHTPPEPQPTGGPSWWPSRLFRHLIQPSTRARLASQAQTGPFDQNPTARFHRPWLPSRFKKATRSCPSPAQDRSHILLGENLRGSVVGPCRLHVRDELRLVGSADHTAVSIQSRHITYNCDS